MAWDNTIRHAYRVPHPPGEVWEAVATGRGNRSWLYPMDIEPWVGGAVARGAGGTVLEWSPPHRFAIRIADGTGFSSAVDYTIDPAADGHADLRTVLTWRHDGEQQRSHEWDVKADAAGAYAEFYHHGLREYLDHFRDRAVVYVSAQPEKGAPRPSFPALLAGLGVPAEAGAGAEVRFTPPAAAARAAVLDYRSDDFAELRTTDGLHRFFNGDRWDWPTWTCHHLFSAVDEQAETRRWQEWLADA